jgi:hypothetical protein
MCGLGHTAGSAAEVSSLHFGVSDLVDRSKRGDVSRHAPASNAGDFVLCLGAFAGRPVRDGTNALGNLASYHKASGFTGGYLLNG